MIKIYTKKLISNWFGMASGFILFAFYSTIFMIDCLHHVQIFKIISSLLWMICVLSYTALFLLKPVSDRNEQIERPSFAKQWLEKQPLVIGAKIIVLVLFTGILFAILRNGEYGEDYIFNNHKYAMFYSVGSTLACLVLLANNIEKYLQIKQTFFRYTVKFLILLVGSIIMGLGLDSLEY